MKTILTFLLLITLKLEAEAGTLSWSYAAQDISQDMSWTAFSSSVVTGALLWPAKGTLYASNAPGATFTVVTNFPNGGTNGLVTTNYSGPTNFNMGVTLPPGNSYWYLRTSNGFGGLSDVGPFAQGNIPYTTTLTATK